MKWEIEGKIIKKIVIKVGKLNATGAGLEN